jgi:hypothetical protein
MGLYSTFVEKVHVLDRREMCWVERRRVFDVMRRTNMAVGQLQITYLLFFVRRSLRLISDRYGLDPDALIVGQ